MRVDGGEVVEVAAGVLIRSLALDVLDLGQPWTVALPGQLDRARQEQALELEVARLRYLDRENRDDHLDRHTRRPEAREDAQQHARGADRLDRDEYHGPHRGKWQPDAVEEPGHRWHAAVDFDDAVAQEDAAHGETHEEGRIRAQLVHAPSELGVGCVAGPRRRWSIRT